jgi:hypothetical protein
VSPADRADCPFLSIGPYHGDWQRVGALANLAEGMKDNLACGVKSLAIYSTVHSEIFFLPATWVTDRGETQESPIQTASPQVTTLL